MRDTSIDLGMKGELMGDTETSIILEEAGWILTKIVWTLDGPDDNIIWASHEGCRAYREEPRSSGRAGDWFPRDNAMFGKCCYCGAKCPESMVVLFHMYNWEFIPHWGQTHDPRSA